VNGEPAGTARNLGLPAPLTLGASRGLRAELIDSNPAKLISNPEPKRREVLAFESVGDLEAVGEQLSPAFRSRRCSPASPDFGLRNGSRSSGATSTARLASLTSAASGRTGPSLRAVPLPLRAAQAL
jgi:hypothetical protein